MLRLVVLGLLVLMTGCLAGPDYRRPALQIPAAFRFQEPGMAGSVGALWWKEFGDPLLDAFIAEAVAGNRELKIAAANVEQAAGILTRVRSPLFPQLSYLASASRERGSENNAVTIPSSVANPQNLWELAVSASWELDLWGRIRRLSEAARADLLASEQARRGVLLSLVASVANSYFQLRGLDEQLSIARRNLAAYAESVRLFKLQYEHGQIPLLNVEQALTQYETAAAAIPQLEAQIAQTENALCILLGRNPGPLPRGNSIYQLGLPAVPAGLPSQLLTRRPDIAQAEQTLVAANAQLGAARALYFPTISLTGAFGFQSAELASLFKGGSRSWSYGGSITGPIFTAGAISGRIAETRGARQAALEAYLSSIQSAFADVDNALIARSKVTEQIQAQERLVQAGREYERLARLQYDGGYAPYLTVLSAQQQLLPAELNLAQLRSSLFSSYVNIYKAMGGGWITEAEKGAASPPAAALPALTSPSRK